MPRTPDQDILISLFVLVRSGSGSGRVGHVDRLPQASVQKQNTADEISAVEAHEGERSNSIEDDGGPDVGQDEEARDGGGDDDGVGGNRGTWGDLRTITVSSFLPT